MHVSTDYMLHSLFYPWICCQYSAESVSSSENADAIAKKVKRICNIRKIDFTHDSKIEVCFIRLDADRE